MPGAERIRLEEDRERERNWKRWGPYLPDRQWGTVREDYSEHGDPWRYFTHDDARSRAYRWGEDGLLGITDRQCRLAFALALWNGRDPILKERLFGLTGPEGNHGEDAKECWYHLESTPTHSLFRSLYKYPQAEFPYGRLVAENARRSRDEPEFELEDTGALDGGHFDVTAEYAKAAPNDVAIRIRVANRGPKAAEIHVLPSLWFRNVWSWGRTGEGYGPRPSLARSGPAEIRADHHELGTFLLRVGPDPDGGEVPLLFTENETNRERLFRVPNRTPFVKDAFHRHVVEGRAGVVNPAETGTKAAAHYRLTVPPGEERVLTLRLSPENAPVGPDPLGADHDAVFAARTSEAEEFYSETLPAGLEGEDLRVARAAYAGLFHTKQFYHYVVRQWAEGDPGSPPPPEGKRTETNRGWDHVFNRDVISMPDKWEYPWYAAWDLAFHTIPFARVDPEFAKGQLLLFLREWYMHPNGAIPAYEFAFSDANPPVHAWAAWRVYKRSAPRGERDRDFLERVFHKLLLNFTWWVNRKDHDGNNLFAGGFLGLDNIGVFDRSRPFPGGHLDQADGTAWMAFYCGTMLSMALELAEEDPVYEDLASKFFEHYVAIVDAMNRFGGTGLWDEKDGFYYDRLHVAGRVETLRIRSLVGLVPLVATEVLETERLRALPGFAKRARWFLDHRPDLAEHISYLEARGCMGEHAHSHRLLAVPSANRLVRVLRYMLDEEEFLSPYGIRSLSKVHEREPFVLNLGGEELRVDYVPGESNVPLFGGNSNWRGPVWLPLNFLLVEALERYDHFYGDTLLVECPTGSGNHVRLGVAANEIARRLTRLFLPDATGRRPCHGGDPRYAEDPAWRDLLLFHEYFHGETGKGLGASHQTGWTALAATLFEKLARS